MVYAIGIIVFAFGIYCVYRERNKNVSQDLANKSHVNLSNVPILSTMENYRIRSYEKHERRKKRAYNSRSLSLAQPLTQVDG